MARQGGVCLEVWPPNFFSERQKGVRVCIYALEERRGGYLAAFSLFLRVLSRFWVRMTTINHVLAVYLVF